MTVENFLKDVWGQRMRIGILEKELEEMRAVRYGLRSPILGDRVQTSHQKELDEVIAPILEREKEIYEVRRQYEEMKRKAIWIIRQERDSAMWCVLHGMYILGKNDAELSIELGYSRRQVWRLRAAGLEDLERNQQIMAILSKEKCCPKAAK